MLTYGVGRVRYQTISGPQGDPFRYLSISVPHETRCRVRDHHQYHFGTKFYFENCSSLHCADCSANKGRCSLFNVWYRNRPGTELDPVPKRYWYQTGYRLVPKRTGTEVITWYRTRPFWYRNGLVPNASGTERDLTPVYGMSANHGEHCERFECENGSIYRYKILEMLL